MNDAESYLSDLLSALDAPAFDTIRIDRARHGLAESLSTLSSETPRDQLERIRALHAMLRALAERRYVETGRSLEAVVQARARCSRLTRPDDVSTVVDVDA